VCEFGGIYPAYVCVYSVACFFHFFPPRALAKKAIKSSEVSFTKGRLEEEVEEEEVPFLLV
jgi:hypothetical protein